MRLTRYTDYAFRTLMHLAARPDRLCSIGEIARSHGISQNHLTKIVHQLGRAEYIETIRGRGGGIRLAKPSCEVNLGQVIRHTEGNFQLADCGACVVAPACGLNSLLDEAMAAFLVVFDQATLSDIMAGRAEKFRELSFDGRGIRP